MVVDCTSFGHWGRSIKYYIVASNVADNFSLHIDNILTSTRYPAGGWEHLSWDSLIVGHLVNISVNSYTRRLNDSLLNIASHQMA